MTEFDQNQENNQSMEDAMKSVQEVKGLFVNKD